MKINLLRLVLSLLVVAGTTGMSYATGGGNESTVAADDVLANSHSAQPKNLNTVLSRAELPSLNYLPHPANVVFKIKVNADGSYATHQTLSTDSQYMAEYIGNHLHKVRFTPAVQNGQHVASWVVIPLRIH